MTFDEIAAVRAGEDFTIGRRTYTRYSYSCTGGIQDGREYLDVAVFKPHGGYKFVRVYLTDAVEAAA